MQAEAKTKVFLWEAVWFGYYSGASGEENGDCKQGSNKVNVTYLKGHSTCWKVGKWPIYREQIERSKAGVKRTI